MRRRRLLGALSVAALGGSGSSVLASQRGSPPRPAASPAIMPRAISVPPPLGPGSRIVAVTPGTWWENPNEDSERLRRRCAAEGWELVVPADALSRWRWFSGSDSSRRAQLERAWADRATDAVFCVAGGWGSARILEAGWKQEGRPLWLVGFSDASALLLAQLAGGRGGAVHGSTGGDEAQWQRLVKLLRGETPSPLLGQGWVKGSAVGPLIVTNLTVATSLIGTPWFPSLAGAVLVLEDVGEAPYRVDRMLTQWRSAGLLAHLAAVGVGRFSWKEEDVLPGDQSLEEVLRERLGDLGVPVVGGLPVGHGRPNLALPLGRMARLDGNAGSVQLL